MYNNGKCGGSMREMMDELNHKLRELNMEEIKDIELLLNFTEEDTRKETDLSYQVTPIFERLLNLSMACVYLDDDDMSEIFSMNQTDFFRKIYCVAKLSNKIITFFVNQETLHPILDTTLDFENILIFQRSCLVLLDDLNRVLDAICKEEYSNGGVELGSIENTVSLSISTYLDSRTDCFQKLLKQTIPMLKKSEQVGNYQQAFNILINYIDSKLELLSGLDTNNILCLSDICKQLHQLLDNEIVEYICSRIELDGKNTINDELDGRGRLNLMILLFENRYQRLQSCKYYYREGLLISNRYKQKYK